jgi:hypothetical protein
LPIASDMIPNAVDEPLTRAVAALPSPRRRARARGRVCGRLRDVQPGAQGPSVAHRQQQRQQQRHVAEGRQLGATVAATAVRVIRRRPPTGEGTASGNGGGGGGSHNSPAHTTAITVVRGRGSRAGHGCASSAAAVGAESSAAATRHLPRSGMGGGGGVGRGGALPAAAKGPAPLELHEALAAMRSAGWCSPADTPQALVHGSHGAAQAASMPTTPDPVEALATLQARPPPEPELQPAPSTPRPEPDEKVATLEQGGLSTTELAGIRLITAATDGHVEPRSPSPLRCALCWFTQGRCPGGDGHRTVWRSQTVSPARSPAVERLLHLATAGSTSGSEEDCDEGDCDANQSSPRPPDITMAS